MKIKKSFALIVLGLTSITAQIIFSRELFVVFYGNELSFGLILGNWLLGTAFGSIFLGHFSEKITNKVNFFSTGQLFFSLFIPIDLVLIRLSRHIWKIPIGEIIGISQMLLISIFILFPYCILSGFLFVLGCKIFEEDFSQKDQAVGYTYIFEAVGSGVGGIFFGYIFITYFKPFQIIFTISLLNLASALFNYKLKILKPIIKYSILAIVMVLLFTFSSDVEEWSETKFWQPFELLQFENSNYGNLVAVEQQNQKMIFENGLFVASDMESSTAEKISHYPLLLHDHPEHVLLIGGGTGGAITEILKHPSIKKLIYTEIDPQIIQLSKKYLDIQSLDNPKVEIEFVDGRKYLKQCNRSFDAIIMNLPDPLTSQINRFYTLEFFEIAKSKLNQNGIICFNTSSSENYISDDLGNFLSSIYSTVNEVFENISVIPGDTNYYLAKKNGATDTPGITVDLLISRLDDRNISTKFLNKHYLPYELSQERREYLKTQLENAKNVQLNSDLNPISYYYDIIIWSSVVKSMWKDILKSLLGVKLLHILGVILLICIAVIAIIKLNITNKTSSILPISFSIFTTGIAEISFQIVIILAFQIFFGYVYIKIGLIYTLFMIGLALGSFFSTTYFCKRNNSLKIYKFVQFLIVLYPLFLILIFKIIRFNSIPFIEFTFPLLSFIPGFMGGIQFPLASKIILCRNKNLSKIASILYSADLFGAFIGAIVISIILIPLIGIYNTCITISSLNVGALLVIFAWNA